MQKCLEYFECALAHNPQRVDFLAGDALSYADLSMFQVVAGLRYAFPRTMRRLEPDWPRVIALHDSVAARHRIAAYLRSARRLPFNRQDMFRHYKELDAELDAE